MVCKVDKLTVERLKELYSYCPATGLFTQVDSNGKNNMGRVPMSNGGRYLRLTIDGVSHSQHRLAVLYMDGSMPERGLHIDHINSDKLDNRWSNLRVVTAQVNQQNQPNAKCYVIVDRPSPYRVSKTFNGKTHNKAFKTEDEAVAYVSELKQKYDEVA